MKKAIAVLAALVLLSPFIAVVGIGTVANPFVLFQGTCDTAGMNVGPVPDELEAETKKGESVTLNKTQLERAAAIITGGSEIEGVTENGVIIALMAALTESTLRQLANSSAYPESTDYPNDGDAADHDSLGLFQMRPQSGWGSVEELMDVDYQVRAFFGGEDGPNHPSPRGLLDIPGWEDMDRGEAAQSVEVSAYPDRYTNWEPVAEKVLDTLTENARDGGGGGGERGAGDPPRPGSWCSRCRRAPTPAPPGSGRGPTRSPENPACTEVSTMPPRTGRPFSRWPMVSSSPRTCPAAPRERSSSSTPSTANRWRRCTCTCGNTASTSSPETECRPATTSAMSARAATPQDPTCICRSIPAGRRRNRSTRSRGWQTTTSNPVKPPSRRNHPAGAADPGRVRT